jgi:hypothetical protein
MGRDELVRVAYRCDLFPFGHRVLLIEETVRRIQDPSDHSGYVASLRKHYYTVRVDRVRAYRADNFLWDGRELPFTAIELLTTRSPNLFEPVASQIANRGKQAFWPSVDDVTVAACADPNSRRPTELYQSKRGVGFCFRFKGVDKQGDDKEFSTPVILIDSALTWGTNGNDPVNDPNWVGVQAKESWDAWSKDHPIPFGRARIALASSPADLDPTESNVAFDVEAMRLIAQLHKEVTPDQAKQPADPTQFGKLRWVPEMDVTTIVPPAADEMLGEELETDVKYYCKYLGPKACPDGTDQPEKNDGDVFLQRHFRNGDIKINIDFTGARKTMGFIVPNIQLAGFSRRFGAIGAKIDNVNHTIDGLDDFAKGAFDPLKYFLSGLDGAGAKIFGAIRLPKLLKPTLAPTQAPKFKSVTIPTIPVTVETRFEWEAKGAELLDADALSKVGIVAGKDSNGNVTTSLKISGVMRTTIPSTEPPTHEVTCVLEDIGIAFIPGLDLLRVHFKQIEFTKKSGDKARVNVEIGAIPGASVPIAFRGAAAFIDDLRRALPIPGFGKGLRIDVDPMGLRAGFDVKLPDISLGAFSLRNIRPTLALELPFSNIPTSVCVGFASRAQPFAVTVGLFGGGGFVTLCAYASADDNKTGPFLEGAIEFGGGFYFSVAGIASGGVHVMAGVYFRIASDRTTLEGYLRAGGEVKLFAIANVGLEVYLGIRFTNNPNELYGSARLTLSIEVLFFSAEVTVNYDQHFAGSSSEGSRLATEDAPRALPRAGCEAMPENAEGSTPFAERMPYQAWRRYWTAFDPVMAAAEEGE